MKRAGGIRCPSSDGRASTFWRWGRTQGGLCLALTAVAAFAAVGCRGHRDEPTSAHESAVRAGSIPRPEGLLLEGAVRRPAELWKRVRSIAGGRLKLLPSSLPLAVTTMMGASPLSAGIIDDAAPIAIALVDAAAQGAGLVAGFRVSSGPELVVALANGADARFLAEPDARSGLTVLRPKGGPAPLAFAVAGDLLIVATSLAHLQRAAAYVAWSLWPSLGPGEVLELRVPGTALRGPFVAMLRERAAALRQDLSTADIQSRAQHGGRAPDFADPAPIIAALGGASTELFSVLESSEELRLRAALLDASPLLRAEVRPEPTGSAHDLLTGLSIGDLDPILRLPEWTRAAILWRRAATRDGGDAGSGLAPVFGDRISPPDRARLSRWEADLGRALGEVAVAGVIDQGGAFLEGEGPEAPAVYRVTSGLVELSKIRALSAPIEAYAGSIELSRGEGVRAVGGTARVHVRTGAHEKGAGEPTSLASFDVASLAVPPRGALVAAESGVDALLSELLRPGASVPGIGADAVLARAAARGQHQVSHAIVVRLRAGAEAPGWAVATVGTDRAELWAEIASSDVAFRALIGLVQ